MLDLLTHTGAQRTECRVAGGGTVWTGERVIGGPGHDKNAKRWKGCSPGPCFLKKWRNIPSLTV